jgi:hypothetical protein
LALAADRWDEKAMSKGGDSTRPDIEFFDQVFEPVFCNFLLKDSREKLASGHEFTRSNYQWASNVVKASAPVLVRHYDPALAAIILDQLIKRGVLESTEFVVMNYAWSRLSYIPWHSDDMHEVAVTVYLNELWDRDWGGVFLYRDQAAEIRGYAPKFNSCVRNAGHIMHSTTMITTDAGSPRLTVQIFPKAP